MSITLIEYHPNSGSPVTLNDLVYPMHNFDVVTNIDSHSFKKLADAGEWPTFAYPGAMTITCDGDIVGSGGTPSNDYIAKRLALLDAILPPIQVLTARRHGFLRIQLDGMTETADADVQLVDHGVPMQALYPAISPYMIVWKGFLPYFVGTSTQTKYQLG